MAIEKENKVLLEIKNLKKYFPITKGFFRRRVGDVKAVDDVSFNVYRGETLGIVGESGCGKTTTGRTIMRGIEPTSGQMMFHGENGSFDIAALSKEQLRDFRKNIQMIFQDPYASLAPHMTILEVVGEPLRCLAGLRGIALQDKVAELLKVVGLDARYMSRYPHAFSGGQRQRIGIARALVFNPDLIIADEAVSALDVSVQAQVLNLFQDLQEQYKLTYLFIAHDLGVVEHICDRVGVMYVGKMVELADTESMFSKPRHPYTEALLSAAPTTDVDAITEQRVVAKGEVADPANRPSGCCFHPRCLYEKDICKSTEPPLVNFSQKGEPAHYAACHFKELELKGVH